MCHSRLIRDHFNVLADAGGDLFIYAIRFDCDAALLTALQCK